MAYIADIGEMEWISSDLTTFTVGESLFYTPNKAMEKNLPNSIPRWCTFWNQEIIGK